MAQTRPGTQQALSGCKHIQLCIPHIMTQWSTISVRWGEGGRTKNRKVGDKEEKVGEKEEVQSS